MGRRVETAGRPQSPDTEQEGVGRAWSPRAEDAWQGLQHLLATLPVPAAPPRYPSATTSIGLSFLDLGLNLPHLVRREERLTAVDREQLGRRVSLRVSLDRLTPEHRSRGLAYGRLRAAPPTSNSHRDREPEASAPLIWLPVARVSRFVVYPIPVFDNEGREVARATQAELLPIVAGGLISLLDSLLRERAVSESRGLRRTDRLDEKRPIMRVLHTADRARWLLQAAVAQLVQGGLPVAAAAGAPSSNQTREPRRLDEVRAAAQQAARACLLEETGYLELLYHASVEYMVVVGLASHKDEHALSYEAPTLPLVRPASAMGSACGRVRQALRLSREFIVDYTTYLPRPLDALHVIVETEPCLRLRDALLTTDQDRPVVDDISGNLRALARRLEAARRDDLLDPFIDYELSSVLATLDDVLTSRRHEWGQRARSGASGSEPESTRAIPEDDLDSFEALCDSLALLRDSDYAPAAAAEAGYRDASRLARLADLLSDTDRGQGGDSAEQLRHLGRIRRRCRLPKTTSAAEMGLGIAVSTNDDPRDHAAHLYWRRPASQAATISPVSIEARVQVVIADDRPALMNSVLGWLAGTFALVALVGAFLFDSPFMWWWPPSTTTVQTAVSTNADAIGALLLVGPTLLFTRVDLPTKNTVAGQVRSGDRLAGAAAIFLAAALGLTVATEPAEAGRLQDLFASLFLALFAVLCVVLGYATATVLTRDRDRLAALDLPGWCPSGKRRRRKPDAVYTSLVGADQRAEEGAGTRVSKISRGGAELARNAASVLASSGSGTPELAVCHLRDRPGILGEVLESIDRHQPPWIAGPGHGVSAGGQPPATHPRNDGLSNGPPTEWRETLISAAFGEAFIAVSRRTEPDVPTEGLEFTSSDLQLSRSRRRLRVLRGHARVNPSFIYRGTRDVEMVIELPRRWESVPDGAYGLALGELIAAIGSEASRANCPLMFVQTPTASRHVERVGNDLMVPVDDVLGRPWPRPGAPAVRFAIAMPRGATDRRLDACEAIARRARDLGASISLGDHRGDRRGGSWFRTTGQPDLARYESHLERNWPGHDRLAIRRILPVTFVGPARVGTTAEIMRYLSEAGVPVLGATIAALDGVSIIHVLCGGSAESVCKIEADDLRDGEADSSQRTAGEVLLALCHPRAGLAATGQTKVELEVAGDYRGFIGPSGSTEDHDAARWTSALWATWRLPPRASGVGVVVETLVDVANKHLQAMIGEERVAAGGFADVTLTNIDYAICRRMDSGSARGRVKMALPPDVQQLPAVAPLDDSRRDLCVRIERDWRIALARQLDLPSVDVEVTWQEERLGRRALVSRAFV